MAGVRKVHVRTYAQWSIRSKLMALLLLLALTTLAVTGTVAYLNHQKTLTDETFNQLTGTMRTKRSQIEEYYRTIHNHVETLSSDRMFIDAMREFQHAYSKLDKTAIQASTLDALRTDYRDKFYPEEQKLYMARQSFRAYMPVTPAGIQLQSLYIVKNPYPQGRRDELIDPGDGSEYSKVHRKYHQAFRAIVRKFAYHDLYLIDADSGEQVYDVAKDRDFGTSMIEGPYASSNLAKVVKQCQATNNPDDVFFSDFEPYEASFGEPTQYVAIERVEMSALCQKQTWPPASATMFFISIGVYDLHCRRRATGRKTVQAMTGIRVSKHAR